jgi:hypothetical protein
MLQRRAATQEDREDAHLACSGTIGVAPEPVPPPAPAQPLILQYSYNSTGEGASLVVMWYCGVSASGVPSSMNDVVKAARVRCKPPDPSAQPQTFSATCSNTSAHGHVGL